MPQPHLLRNAHWKDIRSERYEVAILPWGATEAHNYHLPYGTDTIESEAVAAEAARLATTAGARVIVLPGVPFGVHTAQLDIPFCLNMNPSTQAAVLGDLVRALDGVVRKLVILNGHGGNDFKQMIRELQPTTSIFLCTLNWWTCIDGRTYFDVPGDHAGELETSVMQHLTPELVLPLSEAGPGEAKRFRIAALRDGWAWAPRQWTEVTTDTGVGDPRAATPARGKAFFEAATARIAGFLVELAAADPDSMYQSEPAG
jgi:creatinine amidohydrolase